jgi:UDP-N-acetylmuramoyl-L-alanyl-D-glutamate--2,6-diaminopimelate ligase
MSLRTLLPDAECVGIDDVDVASCVCDSRRVRPGSVFVALAGAHCDGHDFAAEAIQRGCAAIVAERPLPDAAVPVFLVRNTHDAFGRVCHALAGHPSRLLKTIGITGTNGKTTTSCLITSILTTAGFQTGLLGTLGYLDGKEIEPASHTTPPADQVAHWMGRMVANGCTHAVMEMSSHALAQSRTSGISLHAACVTNVRRDHLDYHGTLRDYRLAKSRIFSQLSDEGFAVINADDPATVGYLSQISGPVLTIGMKSSAELTGTFVERSISDQTFLLSAGSEIIPVCTRMIGVHHVYNCLMASAVGLALGLDLPTIVRGLEAVDYVPGRLQRIECGQPFGVFVDYAHTPDALEGSLQALREVVEGRLICLFGAGGDRDQGKRPLMGAAVEQNADLAVIANDNPRHEDPAVIVREILGGFRNPEAAKVIPDREEAIAWALAQAKPGDCVLLAGKGHETCQIFNDHRIDFDDREVAKAWLYAAGNREDPFSNDHIFGA